MHHDVPLESTAGDAVVTVEVVYLMESVGESPVLLGGLHDFDL